MNGKNTILNNHNKKKENNEFLVEVMSKKQKIVFRILIAFWLLNCIRPTNPVLLESLYGFSFVPCEEDKDIVRKKCFLP